MCRVSSADAYSGRLVGLLHRIAPLILPDPRKGLLSFGVGWGLRWGLWGGGPDLCEPSVSVLSPGARLLSLRLRALDCSRLVCLKACTNTQ